MNTRTSDRRPGWHQRLRRSLFITHPLGALVFPSHILRSALCRAIRQHATDIGGRVLDYGCGSKPYESLFEKAAEYIGIDVEQAGHDHANSKVDVFFDGKTIPFADGSFDSVVCFEVLEHVPDLAASLADIQRVLVPGGSVLLSVPFVFPEHETPYDFRRLTRFGLAQALEQAGFHGERITPICNNWLTVQQHVLRFLTDDLLSGQSWAARILRIPLVMAFNLTTYAVNLILPHKDSFPLGFVAIARKPG